MPSVIIYTIEGCPGCERAISFLKNNQIDYEERKLADPKFYKQFKKDGP